MASSTSRMVASYASDWPRWMRDVLGTQRNIAASQTEFAREGLFPFGLTKDQLRLVESVMKNKRTLGQSGHGTGKTFTAAAVAVAFLMLHPGKAQVICTSSSQLQVTERLWAEVSRLYHNSRFPLGGEFTATRWRPKSDKFPKWFAMATATNDPNNIQGGHEEHLLAVIDEAQGVDRGIWEALESMMGSDGGRILAIFNPLASTGPAYENSRKPHEWNLVKLSCLNHPNVLLGKEVIKGAVTRAWVEDRKREWGEGSPLYQARVLGEFPDTSEDTLVSLADLERAITEFVGINDGLWLGVDIARFGTDSNWAVLVHNGKVIFEDSWSGLDTMMTVGKIHGIVQNYDVPWDHINIDGIGVGGGVIDRLREQDKEVNDIQFGAGPKNDWAGQSLGIDQMRFLNRRAELYWVARQLLKHKRVQVPTRFSRIWSDLLVPRYMYRSDGSLKIEGKDDIRARLGRSPDAGDALVLAMARDRNASPGLTFV